MIEIKQEKNGGYLIIGPKRKNEDGTDSSKV